MAEAPPLLTVTDYVTDAERARIKSGLAASDPALGPYRPQPLAVLLHEPKATADAIGNADELIGGLIGDTAWQWLSIRLLWVDPAQRRAGHGRRLLAAAEAEGIRRGCDRARLNTFSFQSAGFYEGCGYQRVLTLEDYPQGHQRLFHVKPLAQGAATSRPQMPRSLRTERLLLRPFQESDLDALARLNANPLFMRHMGPVMTRDDSWRQLAMLIGHWELRGYGLWAVEYQGRLIGRIGLYRPEGWPDLEIGWALDPDLWGRGLATEGASSVLEQSTQVLGRNDPISVIRPDNAASIRVAERLGARYERTITLRGSEVKVYRHRHPY